MAQWRQIAGVSLILAGIPAGAEAQPAQPNQIELFGAGALHKLWDDESSIGIGVSGGGGISVPLTDTLSLRGHVMQSNNERDFGNGVIFEAAGTRYTAHLVWQASTASHAPFFGVGAGGFSYTRTSHHPAEPQVPNRPSRPAQTFTRSDTDTIFGGLAGFTAVSTERFRVRPEVSLWWSRPGYFIAIEVGVIAAWRF